MICQGEAYAQVAADCTAAVDQVAQPLLLFTFKQALDQRVELFI
jgi:hypothetical protein